VGWELKNTTPNGTPDYIKALEQIKDPGAAALSFDQNFEGGSDPGGVRETDAQAILQKYAGTTSTSTPGDSGGCSSSSISPDCQAATGVSKILCAAKRYDPASYSETPMGDHEPGGNPQWIKEVCPAAGTATGKITASCYVDCSGLVNIAVYDAFGYNLNENTYSEIADSLSTASPRLWKQIPFSQVQPGDLIQPGAYVGGHVEIIDHLSGNTIYTFGAHTSQVPQPEQVDPASYQHSSSDVYLHWIGPTS
jgi:cell wall-associated NlpC family hydrolase